MSFGYAVGDFVLLTQLAWRTVQNARRASGEHDELAREASSLHVVLQRLETEVSKPHSILNAGDDDRINELVTLAGNCGRVTNVLLQILEEYNALSEEKKCVTKLWKRIQFGNGEMQDLSAIRLQLSAHTHAITLFLNLLSIGSQGNVERYMTAQGGELRKIRGDINWITATLQAGTSRECSILTSYADDDKTFWKELRRELVKEGYSSEVLRRHKTTIKDYVHELGAIGALDELPYDEPQPSPEVAPEPGLNSDRKVIVEPLNLESRDKVTKIIITETESDERDVFKAEPTLGLATGAVEYFPSPLPLRGARSSNTGIEIRLEEVDKSYKDPGRGNSRKRHSHKETGIGYDGPKHVRSMESRIPYPRQKAPPKPSKTTVEVASPPSTPSMQAGSGAEQGRTQAKVLDYTGFEFWKEPVWISYQFYFEHYISATDWIDDKTASRYGRVSLEYGKSFSFKSALVEFIFKMKRSVYSAAHLASGRDKEILNDFLESANGLWAILQEKLRTIPIDTENPVSILSLLLPQLEGFVADIKLWNSKFDEECKDIVQFHIER